MPRRSGFRELPVRAFRGLSGRANMSAPKLTKRVVDTLPATGAEYIAWDSDITGFGIRVRASGAKTYIVQYRAGAGRKARKTGNAVVQLAANTRAADVAPIIAELRVAGANVPARHRGGT